MRNYFESLSNELLGNLDQVKEFIKKHNPTIGVLTEEILRVFLRKHLPKIVSVEQGFILYPDNTLSKQIDIIIYDSNIYAPFYRINDIVVVPVESVLAVVEVKTTITKAIFHDVIDYFSSIVPREGISTYLFIFNSATMSDISRFLNNYKHPNGYHEFDHDTFAFLPDYITGINSSYHLQKGYVITDSDYMGYVSYFFEDQEGTEINALQLFYESLSRKINDYASNNYLNKPLIYQQGYYKKKVTKQGVIPLFMM